MSEVYKDLERSLNNRTEKEQEEFNLSLKEKYRNMPAEGIETVLTDVGSRINELKSLVDLEEITKVVSITYIAETYFKRSRSWLAHRINGNIVNGKPVSFTSSEMEILKNALLDISNKMREASAKIA